MTAPAKTYKLPDYVLLALYFLLGTPGLFLMLYAGLVPN